MAKCEELSTFAPSKENNRVDDIICRPHCSKAHLLRSTTDFQDS